MIRPECSKRDLFKKIQKTNFYRLFLTKNLNSLSFLLSIGLNDKLEITILLYNSKKKIDIEILFNIQWRFKGYSHFPSLTKNFQFYFLLKFDKFKSFEKKHFHFLNHEKKGIFLILKFREGLFSFFVSLPLIGVLILFRCTENDYMNTFFLIQHRIV